MEIKQSLFSFLDEVSAEYDKEKFPLCEAKTMKKAGDVEYTPLYLYAGKFKLHNFAFAGVAREVINLSSTLCIMSQEDPEQFAKEFPNADICRFEYEDEEGNPHNGLLIQSGAKRKTRFVKLAF